MFNVTFAVLLCIMLQYQQSLMVKNIHDKIHKNVYIYFTLAIDNISNICNCCLLVHIFKVAQNEEKTRGIEYTSIR